ncbi:XRE family transcriptional regulator [Kribbella antibiotica]|uniref:XRE family transcriptional regulator n=1 Tax=Kribbella antibiotica TaxID=190195 RepID=A0A4R4Z2Y2_9ACTN|nr:XRE family transcriptional regulator [Kribbella antibiotica]TDD51760.1 XRE family transcriptional regulator [Kribbella antibiotica]
MVTEIGRQVRALRQRSGLTQEELADRSALSVRSLRDLEGGRVAKPRSRTIRQIADALELPADEERQLLALLTDESPEPAPSTSSPTERISQLPADIANFTGRFAALRDLDLLVADEPGSRTVVISAIGGAGKTALAIHWAHGVSTRFTGGQLYVDLQGFAPGQSPLDPAEALSRFLTALGVSRAEQPITLDERSALFRSMVADRQLLLILDNAATAAQVRPLLPGSSTCATLITSRDHLTGLVARDGATAVQLDALAESEAGELLRRILGDARVDTDRPATAEIIHLCGRLPLALRVVAANLAFDKHRSLRDAATELAAADRLDQLSLPDDPAASVLPAFELSYRPLPDDLKLLFRRLGQLPGSSFGVNVVASLMAASVTGVDRRLRQLVTLNLVQERGSQRFAFHDLLKLFAQRLPDPDAAAGRRALDYYLQSADRAGHSLRPPRVRTPIDPVMDGVVPESFSTPEAAIRWCTDELTNVADAIDLAMTTGELRHAVQLPTAMIDYFQIHRDWTIWLATHEHALEAAIQLGDKEREGILLRDMSIAYLDLREHDKARELLDSAISIARENGHRLPLARALSTAGVRAYYLGDYDAAIAHYEECAEIAEQDGDEYAAMLAELNTGFVHLLIEGVDEARTLFERVLPTSRRLGLAEIEATCTGALAETLRMGGNLEQALVMFRECIAMTAKISDLGTQMQAHEAVGKILIELERPDEARLAYRSAVETAQQLGDPRLEELQTALEQLG